MIGHADAPARGITIRPVGGLGNQLFIYACGRAVSARLSCPLFIDPSNYAFPIAGETPRALELEWIVDSEQLMSTRAPARGTRITNGILRRFPSLAPASEFHEGGFAYDDRIDQVRPGARLRGYFQSWRYFDSIAPLLRQEFHERAPSSVWADAESARLSDMTPWTAVHVRRGDYRQEHNATHHGLLGRDYYEMALRTLDESSPGTTLVVFSDEPDAARELISGIRPVDYVVSAPEGTHPMASIELMSRADAVVTANSSFSWWGAWLADPALTPTIAPDPWFTGADNDERDLCPPQWVRLPISRST